MSQPSAGPPPEGPEPADHPAPGGGAPYGGREASWYGPQPQYQPQYGPQYGPPPQHGPLRRRGGRRLRVRLLRTEHAVLRAGARASAAAIASGIPGTPTVKVNGTALSSNETLTAEGLRNAVTTAG